MCRATARQMSAYSRNSGRLALAQPCGRGVVRSLVGPLGPLNPAKFPAQPPYNLPQTPLLNLLLNLLPKYDGEGGESAALCICTPHGQFKSLKPSRSWLKVWPPPCASLKRLPHCRGAPLATGTRSGDPRTRNWKRRYFEMFHCSSHWQRSRQVTLGKPL